MVVTRGSRGSTLCPVPAKAKRAVPETIRGTVVTQRRRCGKANYRCTTEGVLHKSVVPSYSEHSRTRVVMLPPDEVEAVIAATDRYRAAKKRFEEGANPGLAQLVEPRASTPRAAQNRVRGVRQPGRAAGHLAACHAKRRVR